MNSAFWLLHYYLTWKINFNFFSHAKDGEARDGIKNICEIIIASSKRKENHSQTTTTGVESFETLCPFPAKSTLHNYLMFFFLYGIQILLKG